MSEIRRITIENFQSHEYTVLDFDKGLNVIVGPSDQGKSAVIRAIKWVLYNEPRGMDFIRHGTSLARVTLEMDTGYKITRERSKSKNRYLLIDPEGVESVYEGFGNEIPKEIINVHGIPKVILDADISSSLNIGDQLEGPFMLSETGSVRAKAIGRLTGVHILDNAIRDSMTDLRRENQTSDRIQNELAIINTKLDEYKQLEEVKERLLLSEKLIDKFELKMNSLQNLTRVSENIKVVENEQEYIKQKLRKLIYLNKYEEIANSVNETVFKLQKAERLDKAHKSVIGDIGATNRVMERTVENNKCQEKLNKIEEAANKLEKLNKIDSLMKNMHIEEKKVEKVLKNTVFTDRIKNSVTETENKVVKYMKLLLIKEKINAYKHEKKTVELLSESCKNLDDSINRKNALEEKYERLKKIYEIKDQYDAINNYISDGLKYIENNKLQVKKYTDEYMAYLKKAGKCPMCGNDVSDLKLNEIVKHYEEV